MANVSALMPGSGGINRGRADAPLSFGNESDASSIRFKNKAYSPSDGFLPGSMLERKHLRAKKITAGEKQGVTRSGVLLGNTGGGKMTGGALGPRNRDVATRYFKETEGGE